MPLYVPEDGDHTTRASATKHKVLSDTWLLCESPFGTADHTLNPRCSPSRTTEEAMREEKFHLDEI